MIEVKILRMCKYCKGNIEALPDKEAQELINKGLAVQIFEVENQVIEEVKNIAEKPKKK